MKFLSSERLSEHKYKTPEGYLICTDAILARTGKQTYQRGEVFADAEGDTTEVEIDRPAKEVFAPETLASFENKPITVEHPDENVTAANHNILSVGFVRDVRQATVDGQEVMIGNLVITDEETIKEIENGEHTDLSCGYDCDIIDEENPCQRNIRGNHVALCQQGRAGIAHIVDSVEKSESTIKDEKKPYAITPRYKWKSGQRLEQFADSIEEARYMRNSLEKADGIGYVIVDTKTMTLVDSKYTVKYKDNDTTYIHKVRATSMTEALKKARKSK